MEDNIELPVTSLDPMEEEVIVQVANASKPEDVLDTRTPEEIELDLLRRQEQDAIDAISKLPPEEIAGQFYEAVEPLFTARVDGLMARGAKEVIRALIQWPLRQDKPVFSTKAAEETFSLGLRLLDAKFIILQAAQMDEKILVDKKTEENNTEVQELLDNVETEFKQGEEVNGQNKNWCSGKK